MKILSKKVLRGPNVWSNYRQKLIQMRLDLGDMENFPTDKIPGFRHRIEQLLPRMIEHECSEMTRGGFFTRIDRGTWLGHVLEHIALEIQSLAGMKTGYGRTRGTGTRGIYNIVFTYEVEEAGLFAADAAFRIVEALVADQPYDVDADIIELKRLKNRYGLGPSTQSIVNEAAKRGIPYLRHGDDSTVQLGYGKNQMSFRATISCKTSALGVDTAADKDATKRKLAKALVPVPNGGICSDEEQLQDVITKTGYPIVIKPLRGNQGKGASINITDWEGARKGLEVALGYDKYAVVEKFIEGYDFRLLVINHKFVAAAKRMPAHVIGDGRLTVAELVAVVNADPKRGEGHENMLTQIKLTADSIELLHKNNMSIDSVPEKGQLVYLKGTANLSTGATAIDVTDEVHPEVIFMAERISRIVNLDICGIDIMAENLRQPLHQTGGAVLEVNAAPGFRMHLQPSEGEPRNVAAAVVDMLYPPGKPSRIPIIAITGTNGKTTTTRLMAHVVKHIGYNVGYTTTDGIYINDYLMQSGDTTGPVSSKFILSDPTVDFAVLETARGGLLRSGLSFDHCDIGIITNIKEDHLGLNDIETLADLANVKAVVARSVKKTGWAILNADDEHCVKIASELRCNVAYFSMCENNTVIKNQMAAGKPVAIYEDGYLTIIREGQRHRIEKAVNVPLTCEGKCDFNIANALAVVLAGHLSGFTDEQLKTPLQTFKPGFEQTPGRLNLFESNNLKILVDYAHNPHGYMAIEGYLKNVTANRKIGIITGVGDRRDDDIRECALIACRMFDHVIIRLDKDLRGSSAERITQLLVDGLECGGKRVTYDVVPDEMDALYHALAIAKPGDFIISLSEEFRSVVAAVQKEFSKNVPTIAMRPQQQSVAS